jgi:hypothetical protein
MSRPNRPEPGDLYLAHLAYRLSTGGVLAEERPILILDWQDVPVDEEWNIDRMGPAQRILWTRTRVDADRQGIAEQACWSLLSGTGYDVGAEHAQRLGVEVTTVPVTVTLGRGYLGKYKPNDQNANSVAHLREVAIRALAQRGPWDYPKALEAATRREADAAAELRRAVNDAHQHGMPVTRIARVTGRHRNTITAWLLDGAEASQ